MLVFPVGAKCVAHSEFSHVSNEHFSKLFDRHPSFYDYVKHRIDENYAWAGSATCVLCNTEGHIALDCYS